MSVVTSLVLMASLMDSEMVEAKLDEYGFERCPVDGRGGKVMEVGVWVSAHNHFDAKPLLAKLRETKWSSPEELALLIQYNYDPVVAYTFWRDPNERIGG